MNPDLEAILAADEEARARVEAARRNAAAKVEAAREQIAHSRHERARTRAAGLDETLKSIAEDARRQAGLRQRRREEYLAGLRKAADARLSEAVEAWVRIVRDGPAASAP